MISWMTQALILGLERFYYKNYRSFVYNVLKHIWSLMYIELCSMIDYFIWLELKKCSWDLSISIYFVSNNLYDAPKHGPTHTLTNTQVDIDRFILYAAKETYIEIGWRPRHIPKRSHAPFMYRNISKYMLCVCIYVCSVCVCVRGRYLFTWRISRVSQTICALRLFRTFFIFGLCQLLFVLFYARPLKQVDDAKGVCLIWMPELSWVLSSSAYYAYCRVSRSRTS